MRVAWLLAVSCLAGCELYVAPDETPPEPAPPGCTTYVWCSDSTLWQSDPTYPALCDDPLAVGKVIGECADGCGPTRPEARCASTECTIAEAVRHCYMPRASPLCTQEGHACMPDGPTTTCASETLCGEEVVFGGCTCSSGAWVCAPACVDGLCGSEAVAAAMIGTWQGTGTASTGEVIGVRFRFDPDGHYVPTGSAGYPALFNGADGPGPLRRVHVLGQTELGAYAIIDVEGAYWEDWYEGELTQLRIAGDRMTFRFRASWQSCPAETVDYDLRRL